MSARTPVPTLFVVPPELDGERADRVVTRLFSADDGADSQGPASQGPGSQGLASQGLASRGPASRAEVQRWIEAQQVTCDGIPVRVSQKLKAGSQLSVTPLPPPPSSALPEPMELVVLFEDDEVLVLDKPAGLVVHPAAGHPTGTLVNGLLHRFGAAFASLSAPQGGEDEEPAEEVPDYALLRPGIVHRLDRGTSGVMVVAKTVRARDHLTKLFAAHTLERSYLAIVQGVLEGPHTYDTLHGRHPTDRKRFTTRVRSGKHAVTHVVPLEALKGATLVRCTLSTGRTHQIRVHLTEGGHPLLGDPVYGSAPKTEPLRTIAAELGRPALHAAVLGFTHPDGRALRFEVPPPEDFLRALRSLR